MLGIEFERPEHSVCECCGKTTTRLTRFFYKDDDAYAVYYAIFTPQHPEKVLRGLISVGEWGDDNLGPEGRLAFPFEIRVTEERFQVGWRMDETAVSVRGRWNYLYRAVD